LQDAIKEEAKALIAQYGLRAQQIVADRAVRLFKDRASEEDFRDLQALMTSVTRQLEGDFSASS
jgi:hypothetical protein